MAELNRDVGVADAEGEQMCAKGAAQDFASLWDHAEALETQ